MRKRAQSNAFDPHVHSTFSTYDGMGSPEGVVKRAIELGWGAVAITEHGWIGSAPVLYKAAVENGIKPILGCEFYVVQDERLGANTKENRYDNYHMTVLALSQEGYQNLVAWTSYSMRRENYYDRPRISIDKMAELAPWPLHHNVVTSGCLGSELCQFLADADEDSWIAPAVAYVNGMGDLFERYYIELQDHSDPWCLDPDKGFAAYQEMCAKQDFVNGRLKKLARWTDTPVLVANDSHYQSEAQRKAHIAMRAAKSKYRDNEGAGERQSSQHLANYIYWKHYMRPMEEIADKLGVPKAIDNLKEIASVADVHLDPLDKFSISVPFSGYDSPIDEIRRRCRAPFKSLAAKHGYDLVQARLDLELDAMGDFAHYLVILADILKKAKSQGILTWTRGSAANSLLCFMLGIHQIDSLRYKLMFERFVNPARKKAPDIDVDVQANRYDDFMRIVKEHLEDREGAGNIVQICQYGTVANRSAFKMIAESEGMDKDRIQEISNLLPSMIDSGMVRDDNEAYELLKEEYPDLYEKAQHVFDSISSLGQHPCGWLFATRDKPVEQWIPLGLIPSSNSLVTQYNMGTLEDFGLLKGDFLRLDSLTIMKHVMADAGIYSLADIPLDDAETYEMICQGRLVGVHSLQGNTQLRGCMEVRPTVIDDLVAIQALFRPSGTRTGLAELFVKRRRGLEEWEAEVPAVTMPILEDTYGLPIYQEQILEIGKTIGMTYDEIDKTYQAIKTAKGVGRGAAEKFAALEPTFMRLATQHMTKAEADFMWKRWDVFQGYGFNRGHASSYAILAYKMAFLKCHYPASYYSHLLDVYPDNMDYVAGARQENIRFDKPDINRSGKGYTRSGDSAIRVGFLSVSGIGPSKAEALVRSQPFKGYEDVGATKGVSKDAVESLKTVGAFESFGIKGEDDDTILLDKLGFLLERPKAMRGCKPESVPSRPGGTWRDIGSVSGVELTQGKAFVRKLFWVPNADAKDLLILKASPWANVKSWLFLCVDENGVPFEIIANENKEVESDYLKLLASTRGAVFQARGRIKRPFMRGHPLSFQFWGIVGDDDETPQVWHVTDDDKEQMIYMAKAKKRGLRASTAA